MARLKNKSHHGKVLDIVNNYSIIDCKPCRFKHVYPFPSGDEIDDLYRKNFYEKEKPDYFKNTEEDREWWINTYENYYQILSKLTKGRRLLDIGSGPGYFLQCGEKLGWNVLGFEPSKQAHDYSLSLGVKVVNDYFNQKTAENIGFFDVINMSLILEHVQEPFKMLKTLHRFLNPGGIICVVCPNDYNPFQKVLQQNLNYSPWWVVPLHHLNYFDFQSLTNLIAETGFEVVELMGTFPMEFFLLSGDNYTKDSDLGRTCHSKRKGFENNLYQYNQNLINDLYSSLAKIGVGREIVLFAKQKSKQAKPYSEQVDRENL